MMFSTFGCVSTQVEIQILDVFTDALCVSFSLETPLMLTSEILNRFLSRYANIACGFKSFNHISI